MDKAFLNNNSKRKKIGTVKELISFFLMVYVFLYYTMMEIIGGSSKIGGILLITPIIFMFLVAMAIKNFTISLVFYDCAIHIFLFGGFCALSSLWAVDKRLSISKGIDLFEIAIIMFVISQSVYDTLNFDDLLKSFMIANYAVVLFQIPYYGIQQITDALSMGIRIDNKLINSNVLGMCAAIAVLLNIYFLIEKRISILSIFFMAISIVEVAVTGSMKGLFVLFGGIFLFLYFCSMGYKGIKVILRQCVVWISVLVALIEIIRSQLFSITVGRISDALRMGYSGILDKSTRIRLSLIKLGLKLFLRKPLVGMGIDNPRLFTFSVVGKTYYLHNNYVELLASVGIIGTFLFYWIFIKYLLTMFSNRKFYDKKYCICLTMLLLAIILDCGMVSYYSKDRYIYLLIISMYCRNELKKDGS